MAISRHAETRMAVDVAGAGTCTVPVDRGATPRFLACARVRADTAEAFLRLCVNLKMGACVVYYELALSIPGTLPCK